MQRAEIGCALFLLLLAVVAAREAVRLEIGWGDIGPRAGFFPFWLSVILGLSSLWILGRALLAARQQGAAFLPRAGLRPLATVFLPIVAVVPAIEILGFYLTAFLYQFFYIRWTGRQGWLFVTAVSVLLPVIIFFTFERWFLIPLPKGLLEPYLPL